MSTEEKTLIDKYEEDYRAALFAIENDVKVLIERRKEMKALVLFNEKLSAILEIHESLHTFYSIIFNNQDVLKKFGSERLKQLGFELKATRQLLRDAHLEEEVIENYVLNELSSVGFSKKHSDYP